MNYRVIQDDNPDAPCDIQAYLHCTRCLDEGVPADIEVGFAAHGLLQVWCRNHNINISHFRVVEISTRA